MSVTQTEAPVAAKARAIARPMPAAPAVISTRCVMSSPLLSDRPAEALGRRQSGWSAAIWPSFRGDFQRRVSGGAGRERDMHQHVLAGGEQAAVAVEEGVEEVHALARCPR